MNIALIANPFSGGGFSQEAIETVIVDIRSAGGAVTLFVSRSVGHCRSLARNLPAGVYDAVACLGGDGTLSEVVDGLLAGACADQCPPLAVLPSGRGNSFARDLGIFNLADGLAAMADGRTQSVDICRYTQGDGYHHFVNLMGFGFVTDVAETALNYPWLKDFSYVIGVLYRAAVLRCHRMTLTIDGIDYSGPNCFVEFCNSRYTGGAMKIAPHALIDDGMFDAVILSPLSRISLLKTFPRIYAGTHGSNPAVTIVKGKTATVRTSPVKTLLPDGELFGTTPTIIDVLPGRLRFFTKSVPPSAA
ncbi:MAG: diacylglycerol kinase family protein [Pseudomonadota bacterium]